jgi:hypothetical protein
MSKFKKIIGLTLFLLFNIKATSQIFQHRADVIKEKGDDYITGETSDGIKYISYDKKTTTKASGEHIQTKAIYFQKREDGVEFCTGWKVIEPISETNSIIAYYKGKFVEIAYMQFKDYEINVIYDVVVKDDFCIITATWDNTK